MWSDGSDHFPFNPCCDAAPCFLEVQRELWPGEPKWDHMHDTVFTEFHLISPFVVCFP